MSKSTTRRKSGTAGKVKTYLYNPWRVMKVVVLTTLSSEPQKLFGCGSSFKRMLFSGNVGRTLYGHKVLLPVVGPIGIQKLLGGAMDTLKWWDINTTVSNCTNVRFG